MPVTTIKSESQYKEIIAAPGRKAIQFSAPWDAPSKALTPHFKTYAERYTDVSFYFVDVNDQQDVAMDAHVTKLPAPTFHFYADGEKKSEYVGDSYPALERAIGAFLKA